MCKAICIKCGSSNLGEVSTEGHIFGVKEYVPAHGECLDCGCKWRYGKIVSYKVKSGGIK